MRADLFHGTTSSTLALLRRAMRIHGATTARERARAAEPRGATAAARIPRRAELDARPSRTERQLRILGVGQPPDRAESGIPGVRW
jgi:hypothetical protein